MTIAQATPVALADGGLSSSVAVAAAALVVVLTIVLVFVMVLRSSSGGRRSGAGLGYDAQMGPLGQPQNAMDEHDWRGPGSAGGERGWGQDFADNGQAGGAWGSQQPSPWGSQQGGMGSAGGAQQGGPWGARAGADQGGWNAQPQVASPSRPMAPGAPGEWDAQGGAGAQGEWGAPAQAPSRPGWGAAGQAGSPWDQGAAAPPSGPGWRPAQPTMPAAGPAQQQSGAAWGGQQMNGGWGGSAGAANQPGGWDAGMPAPGGAWGGAPAAQRLGVLVVRQGKEQGKTFELRKDRMTVGRSRESDIFLEDLAVSRLHTTIVQDGAGRYLLRDEGSANGTYVNQQRVNEQILEEGDEIQVGQTILVFGWR